MLLAGRNAAANRSVHSVGSSCSVWIRGTIADFWFPISSRAALKAATRFSTDPVRSSMRALRLSSRNLNR
jgi:hypothetical protein